MRKQSFQLYRALVCACLLWWPVNSIAAESGRNTFQLNPGGELAVQADQGNLVVVLWNRNEVTVRSSGVDEDRLKVNQSGDRVTVNYQGGRGRWSDTTFEIQVPQRFDLDLHTGSGDVTVRGDLQGKLTIATNGGDVQFDDVQGASDVKSNGGDVRGGDLQSDALIRTNGGDIAVGAVNGTLSIQTLGGDISVNNVSRTLTGKTMGGDIQIGNIGGSVELSTMGGDIHIGDVSGGAQLKTAGGDIRLSSANGKVDVSTAGGDLLLNKVTGSISAQTSGGDITAELSPSGSLDSRLSSKGGTITLLLPANARATIDAKIHFRGSRRKRGEYRIDSDFAEVTLERDDNAGEIHGIYEINGGGPLIELETYHGDIRIRKNGSVK